MTANNLEELKKGMVALDVCSEDSEEEEEDVLLGL